MKNAMGIITLHEKNGGLNELTHHRPVAAIPFLGRFRLIDFPLSNMTNSGITNVGVFIQEKPRPLTEHLGKGKWWELDGKKDGLFIFYPYYNSVNSMYTTEMKNFKENLDYVKTSSQEYVIITSSYMLCNINYKEALNYHISSDSDITIMYKNVDNAKTEFLGCDTIEINSKGRIQAIDTNRGEENNRTISMETYIMRKQLFIDIVEQSEKISVMYSLKETINFNCKYLKIRGYEYKGYLVCINDTVSYYKHSMEQLDIKNRKELFNPESPIYTLVRDNAPAFYGREAVIKNSLVANGSVIEGTVENSIISRGVKIEKGAVVKNSILMSRCTVEKGVYLDCIVSDKNTRFTRVKEICGSKEHPIVFEKNSVL
ncbi:MAG: glucose-1-phosphate adenylyltransferase subunit GlgD [Clostridium sp.]|nr:glucose-1-phosphate adenylyltransferase subunit GlgD [Clostridium sp.]MDU7084706.1 glucose-1-phosphate adenylyltransferase subunit GlgD [Clostridium sp.]